MSQFYCMTSIGVRPPHFKHSTIDSAVNEAERLHKKFKCKVEILQVVGVVETVKVPVYKDETKVTVSKNLVDDDLPF